MAGLQKIQTPKKYRALDTSGNNNHGQIYSGRGLEFDGVVDYLDTGTTFSETNHTIALWIYMDDSASSTNIVDIRDANDDGILIQQESNETIVYHVDDDILTTTTAHLNTWIRVVCTYDGTTQKLYVNGILDASATVSETISTTVNMLIGSRSFTSRTSYFSGKMSNFQAWDTAWSADDVTYDYLNPESLALNRGGTSLTESNLKVWYPMQDGHRGQQSYILDGANTGLNDNIVTGDNSTFTTGIGDWQQFRGVSAHDSSLQAGKWTDNNTAGGPTGFTMSGGVIPTTAATTYTIEFSAKTDSTASFDFEYIGEDTTFTTINNPNLTSSFQDYKFRFTTSTANQRLYIGFGTSPLADTESFWIDNVSIKTINDKKHATTVFYGDELIADAKNRTFASGPDWQDSGTTANQWAEDSGTYDEATTSGATEGTALTAYDGTTVTFADNYLKLVATSDGSHLRLAELDGGEFETNMVTGRTYRLSYAIEITAYTSGTFSIGFGDTDVDTGADKTYTATKTVASDYFDFIYLGTTTHAKLFLQASVSSAFTLYLDNFSIKEVGTATGWTDADQQLHIPQTVLQSYNELAWFRKIEAGATGDTLTVTEFEFTTGQTINLWGYAAELLDYMSFFGSGTSLNYMRLKNGAETEKMEFEGADNPTTLEIDCGAAGVIQAGKWVMYTFVWKTDLKMYVYLNGELKGSSDAVADTTLGKKMLITMFGRGYSTGPSFFGVMTEISHYTDVLTQAEINDLFNDGKAKSALEASGSGGLSAYWRNNGLTAWGDLKGSNNGAVTCDETILIPAGVDSTRDNQGFLMNRQRDTSSLNQTSESDNTYGVDLVATSTFAAGEAFSMTFWAKPRDVTANQIMGNTTADSLRFLDTDSFRIKANGVTDNFDINNPSDWTIDDWVHVGVVRNTSNLVTTYVNGVAQSDTETVDEAFDYRYIGGIATSKFRGALDNFLIYDDELSAAEVKRNYDATKGSHRN